MLLKTGKALSDVIHIFRDILDVRPSCVQSVVAKKESQVAEYIREIRVTTKKKETRLTLFESLPCCGCLSPRRRTKKPAPLGSPSVFVLDFGLYGPYSVGLAACHHVCRNLHSPATSTKYS